MAKVTTVTTSYTSDIVVNGTAISADKIYANGTQVRRCIVNGTDVIHKFTRTVDKIASDLTFTLTVRFTAAFGNVFPTGDYSFTSPIYFDVTVTDNGSSGFTSVTYLAPRIVFSCLAGDKGSSGAHYYEQQLQDQILKIGQKTTLTFSDFDGKYIHANIPDAQATKFALSFRIKDPDDITTYVAMNSPDDISGSTLLNYSQTTTYPRVTEEILSDNTVQEY